MPERTVIIGPNESRCFAPKSQRHLVVFVRNVNGKLRISASDDAIRYIAGRRMAEKVREAGADCFDASPTEVVEDLTLEIGVPERAGAVCVYLEERNGKFNLVSGSEIIDAICGNGLRGKVEPDSKIEA